MSISNGFDADFATPAEWARLYRGYNVQVVPAFLPAEVKPGQSWKRPLLPSWTEFQDALIPDDKFDEWYGPGGVYASRCNMGVICGRASHNLFVIDLDIHKQRYAAEWWIALMAVHNNGLDLETAEQRTGGGGLQKLFHAPLGWIPPTNKTTIGVDVRGQGGFAMLAPSIHESGKPYEWLDGRSPDEIEIAMAPEWLLVAVEELVREYGGATGTAPRTHGEGSQPQYDPFGSLSDGRETYMRDLVWAAVTGYRMEAPIPLGDAEKQRVWEDYLRHVSPKSEEALEREGRGYSEFSRKWARATAQWDTTVLEAAQAREARETRKPEPEDIPREIGHTDEVIAPLGWLDMSDWDARPIPIRKWAIPDRVPLNQVGLFSGEGGTGKSIIELMKDVAHVTGKDWLGSLPAEGPAFYLGAEDEADEIHIRLAAIARHYGVMFRQLVAGGLKVLPLLGQDSMLCAPMGRSGKVEVTPLYRRLYEAAGDLKPKNISIDTLSRAFGGNEIDRVQVYAFAMHMQALAKVAQGSVTILSHPSLTGLASGSGISGSTAWHGAFRFRQYLKGVQEEEDGSQPDDDLRELEFKKNQYGPRGQSIMLRYRDGLFLPVNGTSDPERAAYEARLDGAFVNFLRRYRDRQDDVSHKPKSVYYAPKLFADEPEAKATKLRTLELADAMKRLLVSGRVLVETYSRNGRPLTRLVLSPGS